MLKFLFTKETTDDLIEKRVNEVFQAIIKTEDKGFTELQTVQIANSVRRRLNEFLEAKKSECMELSVHYNQRANEIKSALELLE